MIADALAALLIGLVLGVGIVILAGMLTQWTLNISENEVADGMTTTDETIQLADALEAIDEVADAIADENMHGATREMVAEGTAERIKDELQSLSENGGNPDQ